MVKKQQQPLIENLKKNEQIAPWVERTLQCHGIFKTKDNVSTT